MFYKFLRRYNILKVDDTFARLTSVLDTGDLTFEFEYSLSQSDAMQRDAIRVNISVVSSVIRKKSVLAESSRGFTDTRALIKNVLTQMPDVKSTIKKQGELVMAQKNSDVTSKINNEVISQLSNGTPPAQLQQLNKTVYKKMPVSLLKSNNITYPMHCIAHVNVASIAAVVSESLTRDSRTLMHDMVLRQGIDPSQITTMMARTLSFDNAVQGTVRPAAALEQASDPSIKLLNQRLFSVSRSPQAKTTNDLSDDQLVNVLVNEPEIDVSIKTKITIPAARRKIENNRDATNVIVKFVLTDISTGATVDTVSKQLDIAKHLQLYNTPRLPPRVKISRSEISTRANLEIYQVDPNAVAVQVFKKNVYTCVPDVDSYTLVGTYDIKSTDQSLLIQVDQPRSFASAYRVIAVGDHGTQGFEFENVIVKPTHYVPITFISLNAMLVDTGIKLEARQIPPDVIAIQFLARNVSIDKSTWYLIDEPQLITTQVKNADYVTIIDANVYDTWVYEYAARLFYRTGTQVDVGSAVVEFIKREPDKFNVKIGSVQVNRNYTSIDATFSIATKIADTHLDVVSSLLNQQGNLKYFEENVKAERDQLKSVVAHNVQRINLTTGQRENFGTITDSQFSDTTNGKAAGVSPLQANNKYRYEITPLVRAPQTLFEKLVVDEVDSTTKKPYAFQPSKFLHPLTLKTGTITSPVGVKVQHAKDEMQLGAAGQTHSVDVSFNDKTPTIVDANATRIDDTLVTLAWRISGAIDEIDHFLVMQEIHGERHIIGKAHSEFLNGMCQYLHTVTSDDIGSVVYIITPIFNDYTTGAETQTNAVVV